jgi:hypothetical protein
LCVNAPLRLEVNFVARDGQVDVIAEHLSELLDPVLDLLETVRISDIVYENGTVRVPVVDGAEGVKALLASRVPDGEVTAVAADVQLLV